MFVQKGILQYKEETESLFLRRNSNEISFDTFFNSLNLYLIKRYIGASKVRIVLDASGDFNFEVAFSNKHESRSVSYIKEDNNTYLVDVSDLPNEGILYPVISGDLPKLKINGFRYEVDCQSREISPCILITTYNRQEFLIPNLEKLNKCEGLAHVIIVDNARNVTLPTNLSKDKFTVIPNDNLGGTGGFTRGMIEAKKRGFSHIFIMDDDITLIPEVTEKTFSLISSLKEEHKNDWLGYSMLINDNPLVQYELGTRWNGIRMKLNHHEFDVSKRKVIFKNQINEKYNYSAWWSLIMPTSVVDKYGYPFPMFIKFDDIEYALRRENEEIILTNGFAVWHENFDKKFNPYLEYYLMRNACVTNALHLKHGAFKSMWRYFRKFVKYYLKCHRQEMKLISVGYNDYLKGPDFFLNLDIEKNNNLIREIAKTKINILKGLFVYPFVALFYMAKILCTFNKVKKSYIKHANELTSLKYWEGIFNHE